VPLPQIEIFNFHVSFHKIVSSILNIILTDWKFKNLIQKISKANFPITTGRNSTSHKILILWNNGPQYATIALNTCLIFIGHQNFYIFETFLNNCYHFGVETVNQVSSWVGQWETTCIPPAKNLHPWLRTLLGDTKSPMPRPYRMSRQKDYISIKLITVTEFLNNVN